MAHGAGVAGPGRGLVAPRVEILVGRARVVLELVVLHIVPGINFGNSGGASVPTRGGPALSVGSRGKVRLLVSV